MTQSAGNNTWLVATVEKIVPESPTVKSFYIRVPHPLTHLAGQHYELRLTAENGYQAARLYSAADPGDGSPLLHLAIMDVPGGEVSPYVVENLQEGDEVEVRGPFGKYFVWSPEVTRPVLLVGGGSGVVPMHAIFTAHQNAGSSTPLRLIYSARTYDDILFKSDFLDSPEALITLSGSHPDDWAGKTGRITPELVQYALEGLDNPLCYICGMSPFVDAASTFLQQIGISAKDIKTERFG